MQLFATTRTRQVVMNRLAFAALLAIAIVVVARANDNPAVQRVASLRGLEGDGVIKVTHSFTRRRRRQQQTEDGGNGSGMAAASLSAMQANVHGTPTENGERPIIETKHVFS